MIGAVSFVANEYPLPEACSCRPSCPVVAYFTLAPRGALIDIAGHDFAGRNRSKNPAFVRTIFGLPQS